MFGYRNVCYDPRQELIRLYTWDSSGNRIALDSTYHPYIFAESQNSKDAISIFNTSLKKKTFKNQYEKSKYLKETGLKRVFENFSPAQQFLVDSFHEENEKAEFSQFPLKIFFIDIETYSPDEFPNTETANHPVNVITLYDSLKRKYVTWGVKPYIKKDQDHVFVYCKTEKEMFLKFIEYCESDYPDVILGWNSILFDLPYIVNRIRVLFDDETVARLSPVGRVYSRSLKGQFGREQIRWYIDGISCLDYLDIYKRFCLVLRENYKLNSIAKIELNDQKVDYGNTNLSGLADDNWDKFIDYNLQDVRIIVKLEEKLQYFQLLRMLSYVGLTTMEAAMGSMSVIIGACAIRARYRNQRIPTFVRDLDDGSQNEGAYVSEPVRGFQKYIASFDANSLYPSVMMTLNLSPETKMGKIESQTDEGVTIRDINGNTVQLSMQKFSKLVSQEKLSISKAKVLFSQKTKGIIPEMVDHYYKLRVQILKDHKKIKRQLTTLEKNTLEYEKTKDELNVLNIKQHTIKILINTVYGALGNKVFPLGDDDLARSITLTGQAVIKQGNKIIDTYIREKCKERNINLDNNYTSIIYNDTDSVYITLDKLVENKLLEFYNEKNNISDEFFSTVQDIETHLNDEIKKWCELKLNSIDSRITFKREAISDVGLFLQKKRYVLHVLDEEGIPCNKFKYTGVEIARTTMPAPLKPYAKKIVETMLLTRDQSKTDEIISETYEKFKTLPIGDISFVVGLKGYEKYASRCTDFKTVKSMPCHVKAAYMHNLLLKTFNVDKKYEKISSGDKIRYFYVRQPNKYAVNAIAYKYYYPEEFVKFFEPDHDMMFEKIIYSAVERFYEAVNWSPRKPGEAVQCDLFSLLSS
jgi:DNA polymerase elongation subunit (family B)